LEKSAPAQEYSHYTFRYYHNQGHLPTFYPYSAVPFNGIFLLRQLRASPDFPNFLWAPLSRVSADLY